MHHQDMRRGSGEVADLIDNCKAEIVHRSRARSPALRPQLWLRVPYVLSFFHIAAPAQSVLSSDRARQSFSALLEPSQVGRRRASGTGLAEPKDIQQLSITSPLEHIPSADLRVGCVAYCSWAGAVFFDPDDTELGYFEKLETRLQLAWFRAHLVRTWAESVVAQSCPLGPLEDFGSQTRPLLRKSKQLIDSAASTRDQKLFDELSKTSELVREIDAAQEALVEVTEKTALEQERRRRRYDRTVEALLIFLAVLQIIPLLIRTPFAELEAYWLPTLFGPLAIFLWIRHRRS